METKEMIVGYDKRLGKLYVEYRTEECDFRRWLFETGPGSWSIKLPKDVTVDIRDKNGDPIAMIVQTEDEG